MPRRPAHGCSLRWVSILALGVCLAWSVPNLTHSRGKEKAGADAISYEALRTKAECPLCQGGVQPGGGGLPGGAEGRTEGPGAVGSLSCRRCHVERREGGHQRSERGPGVLFADDLGAPGPGGVDAGTGRQCTARPDLGRVPGIPRRFLYAAGPGLQLERGLASLPGGPRLVGGVNGHRQPLGRGISSSRSSAPSPLSRASKACPEMVQGRRSRSAPLGEPSRYPNLIWRRPTPSFSSPWP